MPPRQKCDASTVLWFQHNSRNKNQTLCKKRLWAVKFGVGWKSQSQCPWSVSIRVLKNKEESGSMYRWASTRSAGGTALSSHSTTYCVSQSCSPLTQTADTLLLLQEKKRGWLRVKRKRVRSQHSSGGYICLIFTVGKTSRCFRSREERVGMFDGVRGVTW